MTRTPCHLCRHTADTPASLENPHCRVDRRCRYSSRRTTILRHESYYSNPQSHDRRWCPFCRTPDSDRYRNTPVAGPAWCVDYTLTHRAIARPNLRRGPRHAPSARPRATGTSHTITSRSALDSSPHTDTSRYGNSETDLERADALWCRCAHEIRICRLRASEECFVA